MSTNETNMLGEVIRLVLNRFIWRPGARLERKLLLQDCVKRKTSI